MQPQIIDNFLPLIYQQSLESLVTGPEFPWIFNNYSVSQEPLTRFFHIEEPYKEHIQFRHIFALNGVIKSEWFKYLTPLLATFEQVTGKKIKSYFRIKANLLMPQDGPTTQQPHADNMIEYTGNEIDVKNKITLLYYVNDSDGDTVIYNEYFNGKPIGLLTKQQTVTPVKNRAIIFDSNQLHAGCCPSKSDYRMVINLVLEV
jgi:hypothetical protein